MNVPDDLFYTESHEWIKREGDKIRVGITDHAQSELTDVVFVELPKMDRQANAKEAIAVVESVKAASDIYAPVKGTVVEVNKALEADPGLINREPFGQGWLFVLKIDNAEKNHGNNRCAVAINPANRIFQICAKQDQSLPKSNSSTPRRTSSTRMGAAKKL